MKEKLINLYKGYSDELNDIEIENIEIINPLDYSFSSFSQYLKKSGEIKNIFIGINPSINGMCQTGIPFGDVVYTKDYLKVDLDIDYSKIKDISKHKIKGYDYTKREISGKRLWGVVSKRYPQSELFLKNNIVLNYTPLCFLSDNKNITPDKLEKKYRDKILDISNKNIKNIVYHINPNNIIGVGNFTYSLFKSLFSDIKILKLMHPSPLNLKASGGGFENEMNLLLDNLD